MGVIVFNRIIMVLAFILCFQGLVLAADNPTVRDRVVGGTFKTMAKAYIATADIGKLKNSNIRRIESMRPDWFNKQYAEVYTVIKDLPPKLRKKYGVRPGMTKAEAITIIRSLDKKQIYAIIDQVPDPMINEQFNAQFSGKDNDADTGLMDRVGIIWGRVVAAVNQP
jgi:hypothetical protein